MTLLLAVFAAVTATAVWYFKKDETLNLGILCFLFWGASIMWLVDAIFEYAELGAEYFSPSLQDMANDDWLYESSAKIAMPKIGCGLDKLQWSDVERIIHKIFDETNLEILVCDWR